MQRKQYLMGFNMTEYLYSAFEIHEEAMSQATLKSGKTIVNKRFFFF